ncbi:MAG: hypothetical protein AAFZ67_08510 [Planctomycetota bacterium]
MPTFDIILILALLLTAVFTVVKSLRGRWGRAVLFGVLVGGVLVASRAVFMPVRPGRLIEGTPKNIVYLGLTDAVYLRSMDFVLDLDPDAEWVFVGPPGSGGLVRRLVPEAAFSRPSVDAAEHGITLTVALSDLAGRLPDLEDGGNVYFFGMREENLKGEVGMCDRLVASNPWLASRMFTLFPGEAPLTAMPAPPTLTLEAPLEVPQDATDFDAEVASVMPAGFNAELVGSYMRGMDESDASGIAEDGSGNLTVGAERATTLVQPSYRKTVTLDAPAHGAVNIIQAGIYTEFGECVASAQVHVQRQTPRIGVIQATSGYDGKLMEVLKGTSLQYQAVRLDLSGAASPEANARVLEPWGALLLDQTLTKDEGKRLADAVAASQKRYGAAPRIVMVGMAGGDRAPEGWAPFMRSMPLTPASRQRVVVVACDFSGSMGEKRSNLKTPTGKLLSRIEVARDLIRELAEGLVQRNSNDLLLVLDQNGNAIEFGTPKELASTFMSIGTRYDNWEGGNHIVRIDELLKKYPISDALLIWDSEDVRGMSNGDRGDFTDAQRAAAESILSKSVNLYVVSIDGDLTGGNIPGGVKNAPRVNFTSAADVEAIKKQVRSRIFREMLPRLRVEVEEEGLARASSTENAALLRAAASNPNARLINSIGKFVALGKDGERSQVLLYARHFRPGDARRSPLFVQGEMSAGGQRMPTYWLAVDLVAEHAYIDDTASATRNALLDLLVASIGVTTTRFEDPPVYWRVDGSGLIRAFSRNRTPFNITPDGSGDPEILASAQTADGMKLAPSVDLRRLARPGFGFEGLDDIARATIEFEDRDPAIGEVKMSMLIAPMPPRLILDPRDRSLIAPAAGTAPTSGSARAPGTSPSAPLDIGIPAWIVPPVVLLCGFLIAVLPRML